MEDLGVMKDPGVIMGLWAIEEPGSEDGAMSDGEAKGAEEARELGWSLERWRSQECWRDQVIKMKPWVIAEPG